MLDSADWKIQQNDVELQNLTGKRSVYLVYNIKNLTKLFLLSLDTRYIHFKCTEEIYHFILNHV